MQSNNKAMEDRMIGLERMHAEAFRFEPDVRYVPNNAPVVRVPVVYPMDAGYDTRRAQIDAIRLARAALLAGREGPGNG